MLIEAPYKIGDVITIKLSSGEELVGKFEEEDDKTIKVNKPLTLVAGQKGIGLQQFLFTADMNRSYRIKQSAISLIHITRKEFADAYTSQTSNIMPAPPGMADIVKK
tara:strand:- start:288 stop:608 length:321 start_codon:yes stop_codon:yes gene_type:complete